MDHAAWATQPINITGRGQISAYLSPGLRYLKDRQVPAGINF